jgi:ketosteroid isomerase-like protein
MLSQDQEQLIQTYLEIVATDNYERFGTLLTEDCTFTLMPIGHTFQGREEITAFVRTAGGSRTHTEQSKVHIKNWFTDGQYLCVEYDHTAILQQLHYRMQIDGYCWVFHIRDGKFDAIREYINPSRLSMSFLTVFLLRLLPWISRWQARSK